MKNLFEYFIKKYFIKKKENSAPAKHPIFSNPLMAHALGGYKGNTYLNSMEAFESSLENGFQYFEIDLSMTSDGRLVVCHGWKKHNCKCLGLEYQDSFQNMTYEMARSLDIRGGRMMDVHEFYTLVKQHPNLYFELDFNKLKGAEAKKRILALLEDFKYDKECLDRLLIQVLSKEMYKSICGLYPFKYYQFCVGTNINKLDDIIAYCKKNNICALALRYNLPKPADVKKIKDAGLHILCYTIADDVWAAQKLLASGVDTICTDFITPKILSESEFKPYNTYYIYYNSGSPETKQAYTQEIEQNHLRGSVKLCTSGALEFMDADAWENGGTLKRNLFSKNREKFIGWKLRTTIGGKTLWFCNDKRYRTMGEINKLNETIHLFNDEELLPAWTAKPDQKYVMVAVWEDRGGI